MISSGILVGDNDIASLKKYPEKIVNFYKGISLKVLTEVFDFKDRIFKPPDYEIKLIDASNLKNCFESSPDTESPCLLVDMDIRNNQDDSITFELTGRTIVTGDGRQLEKFGGLYSTRQLNSKCDTENFFKLFPQANKKVGICFPEVSKNENPVMYIGIMANGKQKEHNFDLKSLVQ